MWILAVLSFLCLCPGGAHGALWSSTESNSILKDISLLSESEIQDAFRYLIEEGNIPYLYDLEGCAYRAHRGAYLLETERGIKSAKIFLRRKVDLKGTLIQHESSLVPGLKTKWIYHVALLVKVSTAHGVETQVVDPSLFDRGVSVDRWVDEITLRYRNPTRFKARERKRQEGVSQTVPSYYANRLHVRERFALSTRSSPLSSWDPESLSRTQDALYDQFSVMKTLFGATPRVARKFIEDIYAEEPE